MTFKYTVELTTSGLCPQQEDVEADNTRSAVYQFLEDYVTLPFDVSLRPVTDNDSYPGWHEFVIRVSPAMEEDDDA